MRSIHAAIFLMVTILSITGCSETGVKMKRDFQLEGTKYISGDPTNKGYSHDEASQFIEFCVDLDSQDDRLPSSKSASHDPTSTNYRPLYDTALWKPIFDSRIEVTKDVISFREGRDKNKDQGWANLYDNIIKRATKAQFDNWTPEGLAEDPRFNGFGPYQLAWRLYQGVGKYNGSYAIAIRGTVFSSKPSVVEDTAFHPVFSNEFLNSSVSFASFNGASMHSGFAHGTFSLLFDDRYGVIRQINEKVPPASRLYIAGHSQGAAMATLTHAFLHYAMKNASAGNNVFGLSGKNYKLKSYAFAQPKPGNYEFSGDFSNITQDSDNAIVINNDIDPVPQVPLTLQDLGDLDHDLAGTSTGMVLFHYISGIGSGIRGLFGRVAEFFTVEVDKGWGYYYNYPTFVPDKNKEKIGSSWNFTSAGHVIWVYGNPADPANKTDPFLQHHAYTYRNLINTQLNP